MRIDDDADAFSSAEETGWILRARTYATSRVNFLLSRYEPSELNTSWQVNEWATVVAARWLCTRRGNTPPASINTLYEEAMTDMKEVRDGKAELADCGARNVPWPTHSSIRVDHTYNLRKARVERPLSEQTPIQGRQSVDRAADFLGPNEEW